MSEQLLLPAQFQDLEPLLSWALPSEGERSAKRHASSMAELRAFYHALIARMPELFESLNGFLLTDTIPAAVNRLFLMTLSWAEIAPAVENFGQPGVLDGYDFSRFIPVHDQARR
jgi:hypothetical protein